MTIFILLMTGKINMLVTAQSFVKINWYYNILNLRFQMYWVVWIDIQKEIIIKVGILDDKGVADVPFVLIYRVAQRNEKI